MVQENSVSLGFLTGYETKVMKREISNDERKQIVYCVDNVFLAQDSSSLTLSLCGVTKLTTSSPLTPVTNHLSNTPTSFLNPSCFIGLLLSCHPLASIVIRAPSHCIKKSSQLVVIMTCRHNFFHSQVHLILFPGTNQISHGSFSSPCIRASALL